MNKRYNFKIILILSILYFNIPAFNQSYNIHNYSVKNGLPSGVTFNLVQDISGRMWFSSNIGVLEFDNLSWKLHDILGDRKNTADLRWLVSDNKGIVYVFSRWIELGGYLFHNDKWKQINGPEKVINETQTTGIAIVEKNGKKTIGLASHNNGIFLYSGEKWRHITKKDGLLDDDIISIDAINEKFYVISKKGISIVSDKLINNELNIHLPNKGTGLTGIKIVPENNQKTIWITGTNWIGKIANKKFIKLVDLKFKITKEIGNILESRKTIIEYDRRGRLFFGNINSLYFLDLKSKRVKKLEPENGIATRGITSILQDRELNIWTSTKRGIDKIVSLQFENYSMKNGLFENEVTAVEEIAPGIMVFGHNNGLTIKKKNNYKKIQFNKFLKKNLSDSRTFDIFIDSKKRMWVAAGTAGFFQFDTSSNYNFIKQWDHDLSKNIVTVIEDGQNRIWAAGSKGIWRIKNNKLLPVKTGNFPRIAVRKMFLINKKIYFSTLINGILTYDNNKWKRYYSKVNKLYNSTYAVQQYKKDHLLIGGTEGLFELRKGKLQIFSQLGWKITNPVYFITKDKKNNYWIGTKNGVIKFNETNFKYYTHLDGLVGVECNRDGGFVDSSDKVWLGMDQGLSKYTPDMIDIPTPKPLLKIIKIKANNIEYDRKKKIRLGVNSILEFYYKGISLLGSRPLQYKYKLKGYEEKWKIKTFPDGYVRYNNLSKGKYSFMIKAINGSGIESDISSIKDIEVIPPFYLSYWFALIALTLILISSFLFRKIFVQIKISKLLKREIYQKNIQLKESLLSYQSLFEESLDCIFTSTPDGMFLSINQAGLDMFGYKNLKEISRKKIQYDIYIDRTRRDEFKRLMQTNGYVKNFESNIKKKDSGILIVIESSYLLKNNRGETIGYRGIIKDITDQHILQTQLIQAQKMESIGLLAGGIAHDFNNILSGILGYANLLKRLLSKDKKLSKYINTIEKSAERAADLTKKLLGFARQGKYKVTLTDLNDVINEVTNLLHPTIDKSIKIELNLMKPTSLIEADASQIQQVIMNICLNARDALPNGGFIKIYSELTNLSSEDQMRFALTAKAGKYLKVSIKDNGFGITNENLQKIFDPFFTTKKVAKGSGLGLSMVYGVIKNHNGALNVQSKDNNGTTFNLYFPLNNKKYTPKTNNFDNSDIEDLSKTLYGTDTILIIDDEEVHSELLETILLENGYSVIIASDGVEGIKKYLKNKKKINAIILDMSMPKMSGSKTFIKLREISPEIKVLVNSGYSMDDNIQKILNFNGTDFIQKPFKPRHFLIKLKALLGRQ